MICPNCEFEIEDDTEICPYCHMFVKSPDERTEKQGELAARQGEPAGQLQAVPASPAITSKREFLKSPEMKKSRRCILISLAILYLSFLSGLFYWWIFRSGLEIIELSSMLSWWFVSPLSWLGGHTFLRILWIRILGVPVFAVYLYGIYKLVALLIIQRTYNRVCAIIFLLPQAVWDMWWVFLGLSVGAFWSVIIAWIEPAAIILLAVVLCRVHNAWQRYEKTQIEEKLSRHTLLKGEKT